MPQFIEVQQQKNLNINCITAKNDNENSCQTQNITHIQHHYSLNYMCSSCRILFIRNCDIIFINKSKTLEGEGVK